jgi:hypothetical protein
VSAQSQGSIGRLVISLDFELHWGVRDKRSVEQYRENLLGVRKAIPAMLRLFEELGVHATWATVGFLFFDGRDDLMAHLPEVLPAYSNTHYSPYDALTELGASEEADPFHFAPTLIRQIVATPGQELGTHTFSHYYCLEPGNDGRAFEADLVAAQRAAKRFGVVLQSMVFPRNQVHRGYLPICAKQGIRAYRGTQQFVFYNPKSDADESLWIRAGRLADNYLPLSGHNTFARAAAGPGAPYDLPASAFLRPYSSRLKRLEPLRKRRILNDLTEAADHGRTYHLWWHPHNFGTNLDHNLGFLRSVLEHVVRLRETRGMQSLTMGELVEQFDLQPKSAA